VRIPDNVLNCVSFIAFDRDPLVFRGTGFFVSVSDERNNFTFSYLVTAAHVAKALGSTPFAVGLNLKDGGTVTVKSGPEPEWWFHPTEAESVDVAVARFATPHSDEYEIHHVPWESFVTRERMRTYGIGVGDEIFAVGLFTGFSGLEQHCPIVRTGNIAMIPAEKIPVNGFKPMLAYLAEGRSIGGLSGSPVFVRNTVNMAVSDASGQIAKLYGIGDTHFLGLMHGHWDIPADLDKIPHSEMVNMGISIVVPAHKIIEVLQQPALQKLQEEATKEF